MKIDSTEELETNLIGVTDEVLAVNFIGAVFVWGPENLLQFGAGIIVPLTALGLFIGLRTRSVKLNKEASGEFHASESEAVLTTHNGDDG